MRIGADAARQVDAHQAEPADRVLQHLERDGRIRERDRRTRPHATGISPLRRRHLLVPVDRHVATLGRRQRREIDRQRPDRAHHVDTMAELVHRLELAVEIEPLGPAPELVVGALFEPARVAAAVVDPGIGHRRSPAQPLDHRTRPPVEMRVDDVHRDGPPAGRAQSSLARKWSQVRLNSDWVHSFSRASACSFSVNSYGLPICIAMYWR